MEVIVKMFNLKIYAYDNNHCPRYHCLGVYIYYLSNGNPSLSLFLLYLEK